MPGHDIIVVGASAGGVEALSELLNRLPADLPASIFIIMHMPAESPSLLAVILNRASHLPVIQASEGLEIKSGQIYTAQPGYHLLIEVGKMRLVKGPKENRHRPAIDPLFRSAAVAYGPRVIGVVLTGALDDGTAGLAAIKKHGGITIVQNPNEAMFPGMPLNALRYVDIDFKLTIADLATKLVELASTPAAPETAYPVHEDMLREIKLVEMDAKQLNTSKHFGTPSTFSCPECGGVLWELHENNLTRFRCWVGHAFSIESVQVEQNGAIEKAL